MSEDTRLRSPLGRVRGLGSAKEGVAHWWAQRVTAMALIPLDALVRCLAHFFDGRRSQPAGGVAARALSGDRDDA